jgi:alpha-galactosidase
LSESHVGRKTTDMSRITTITFLGAGSVVFTRELMSDLLGFTDLGPLHISLHDINPERLETAVAIANATASQLGRSVTVTSSLDRRAALHGAHYVINSIQVGMHEATVRDIEIPASFGLRQTIADTIGVGGIFRALRTFPVLEGIARDMLEICPDAWLLNYTNPMAMNIAYLQAIAPSLKVLGLCHSVYWTVRGLCDVIDVPFDEVSYWSAGVNHQAWVLRWERNGESLYPLLDAKIASDPELRRRVRVDMYRKLGYYPTETSEHSSEYVPWYLKHDEEVDRLRIAVSGYIGISEDNLREYDETRATLAAGEPLAMDRDSTEYAPQVIHSMETGTKRTIFANVANHGYITNLPNNYAVEVPTSIDEMGAHPIYVGDLPLQCVALNRSFVSVGELTVQAAVTGNPMLIRNAAMVDPNTAATLTVDQIWSLCDALTTAHGDLLAEPLRVTLT